MIVSIDIKIKFWYSNTITLRVAHSAQIALEEQYHPKPNQNNTRPNYNNSKRAQNYPRPNSITPQ